LLGFRSSVLTETMPSNFCAVSAREAPKSLLISRLLTFLVIYVPLGYAKTFAQLTNLSEVRGGSPWGAGTFAVSQPPEDLLNPINLLQGC
jgi:hypothetical protein